MAMLDPVIERFARHSPVTLMARLAMQRAIEPGWIDELFAEHARQQYTRELLFSTTVELMGLVALGLRPSLHAAAKAAGEALPVSIAALYAKVNRTEPALVRALVTGSASRLAPLRTALACPQPQAVAPGWRVRILDGNHLTASERRLKALRGYRGAALPGQALVVYDPDSGLVVDMVPGENAHASEQTLVEPLLQSAGPGELWVADRGFSTRALLGGFAARGAAFIVREHPQTPRPRECESEPLRACGRIESGSLAEQRVWLEPPRGQAGETCELRRIELTLDAPTESGETRVRLLTNLAPSQMDAASVARLYRRRWTIEALFQRLESVLHSEVASLGQPRAALLALGVAVLAYNVLAVLQAAVAARHAAQIDTLEDISPYYLAGEIRTHYAGMLVGVDAPAWDRYDRLDAPALAHVLLEIAACVKPARLRRHVRGPKRATKQTFVSHLEASRHVATSEVIARGRIN